MRTNRIPLVASPHGSRRLHLGAWLAVVLAGGCAAATTSVAPGTSALVGTVRLVPHEGVTPPSAGGSYADRALRDAELVDYAKPGFAVVSVAGLVSPGGTARVALRSTRFVSHFEPRYAALGVGGSIAIRNDDSRPHVLSCPSAGVLTSVAPGAEITLPAARVGELRCFAPGAADGGGEPIETTLYVAPGPYAVVGPDGGFALEGLRSPASERGSPAITVVVWHPRFPPLERPVSLTPGSIERLELELQVR